MVLLDTQNIYAATPNATIRGDHAQKAQALLLNLCQAILCSTLLSLRGGASNHSLAVKPLALLISSIILCALSGEFPSYFLGSSHTTMESCARRLISFRGSLFDTT